MDCKDHGYRGTQRAYANVAYHGKMIGRHVKALIESSGEQPEGRVARHSCDNPRCIEPSHLTWGTQKDNMRDRSERSASYQQYKMVEVDKAKELRQAGCTLQEIANVFGCTRQAIHKALKNS